jgi:hypothetical protein
MPTQTTNNQVTGQATVVAPAVPATQADAATRAELKELKSQLEMLQSQRRSITQQIRQLPPGSDQTSQLQDRLLELDERISTVNHMLAPSEPPRPEAITSVPPQTFRVVRSGPPTEIYYLGLILTAVILFPFSVAYALRMLKRGTNRVTTIAGDLADRLTRMEATIDATALEVERIGEGQRYVTRLLTQSEASPLLVNANAEQNTVVNPAANSPR